MEIPFIEPGSYVVTRWIFLRLLGAIYLVAFVSFGVQAAGLIGENGILPAGRYLAAVRRALGRKGYYQYPTLAWINSSDAALSGLCITGAVLAGLLVAGLEVTPVLVLLWALYLSLVTIGQTFLSYQWDVLLVEAGFLAIFLVPPSLLPEQAAAPPSPLVILLFRWLLFRLMFMSGILKLASGDPTWRDLTALTYHYQTQPLPTPLAWRFHHLPVWFQKLSTLFALAIEVAVPFLYFGPQPMPLAGAGLTVLLQALILLTGNFAFFNLLTIALAIFLVGEAQLQQVLPELASRLETSTGPEPAWWGAVLIPLAVAQVAVGALFILTRTMRKIGKPRAVQAVLWAAATFRVVNPYGLFTTMTTRRPEIVLEGSHDGKDWKAYEFKYKPGDLRRRPPIVAPHQPRLDWQMWFAALGTYHENPWLLHFIERLLDGAPQVLRLIESNPFPEKPPTYIRAILYDYQFTRPEEKARSGRWWRREVIGYYLLTR